jgi:microsomal dipeptidase-like Zn-dependent dipeptidase
MTDDMIKALAAKGGVIQINFYPVFLQEDYELDSPSSVLPSFTRIVDHIDHVVELVGIDHVGIGTDFDGDGKVQGCSSASQLRNITRELLRRGYSHADIEKIWGGNWLRVMQQVQAAGI